MFRFSAEKEYRAMAYTTCELLWLKNLLTKFDFKPNSLMPM